MANRIATHSGVFYKWVTPGTKRVFVTVTDAKGCSAYAYRNVIITAPATITCTDSDGGKNYYARGTVTIPGATISDACVTENLSSPTSILSEYYCENGVVKNEVFTCPTGYTCQDGACKTTVATTIPSYGRCSDGSACSWCGFST